jgi:hypothetical protein
VEPQQANVPAQQQPESGGLFGLGSIFQSQQEPSPEPDFLPASYHESLTSNSEPLSQEAERILASAPEHIGDTVEGQGKETGAQIDGAAPAQPMPAQVVSAANLSTILQLGFGFVADMRKRECYRLEDGKAGELAGLWVDIVNRTVDRYLPAFLAQWGAENPGLLAAMVGTAMIVGPMVQQDVQQTAQEKAQRRGVVIRDDQPQQRQQQNVPNVPPAHSAPGGAVQWSPEAMAA